MTYRVGVDIGGTFIDFCVFDEATQELVTLKVLTTPGQPGAELIAGMERLEREHGVDPKAVTRFIHGTTVGVNTVIQRRGARLALFTTENFVDVLEVARLRMPESYSLFSTRPPPLVPRDRVFGVTERMRADGSVATPLDEASVSAAIAAARDKGVEGILVSLLHGWRNPAHEQAVAAIVRREAPELFVFMSSDIWPVIREYERSTTTVINGYIHPRVSAYLGSLQDALAAKGVPAVPLVTKSNGGVMSAEAGKTACVNMVLSGTASGVMGGAFVAERCGLRDVITLDIGGTSADVAVIIDGAPQYGMGEKIGEFPLYVPSVSVTSIGDGGGSIAWVDAFGVLKVGPESAGSDPGPACYGQGGTEPTLTDAFAVCGFLGHHALAYGSVAMDVERARTAIGGLAERLGRDPVETAEAVIEVAVARMYMEINKLAARYGIDIRDFALLTFGGAGPMAGCFLGRELGMRRIVVPPAPGVTSALGGLIADLKNDFIRTVFLDADADAAGSVRDHFAALADEARRWLQGEQGHTGAQTLHYVADMRYAGQSFEIDVPLDSAWAEAGDMDAITGAFHDRHEAVYDFCDRKAAVQILNLRLVIVGETPKPALKMLPERPGPADPVATIPVHFDGAEHQAPLFERESLLAGQTFTGPAVIAQADSTTCVPGGFTGRVDAWGNVILERDGV
jgi:N-methylhydantoinase A